MTIVKPSQKQSQKLCAKSFISFSLMLSKMHRKENLEIENLLRKISPFFKTVRTKEKFYLKLKGSEFSISIEKLPFTVESDPYFLVKSGKHLDKIFHFSVRSYKELLEKLMLHDLI